MADGGSDRDAEVQVMLDKAAIREVLWRYCRGVDRLDADIVTSCYHPDAFDDHMGKTYSGETVGQGLVDWMDEVMVKTTHNITTNNIDVYADGRTAGSESYTTSNHVMKSESGGRLMQSVARYVDRFEKRGGEWRIIRRLVVAELSVFPPVTLNAFDDLSRRDRSDPSYEVLP